MFFSIVTHAATFVAIPLLFELHFLPSNLHLLLHDVCFVNVFGSFIPAIMLNTFIFESSVLFGTHTLLDKSFRVLQVLTYLNQLQMESNVILEFIH